jgi:uncharacterized protein
MTQRVHVNPELIFSVGTQVVSLVEVRAVGDKVIHPRGAVGVITQSPSDNRHSYRVRFVDGFEASLRRADLVVLAHYKQGVMNQSCEQFAGCNLYDHVIYRCIVGSRAFGLDHEQSDVDRRGIYLPPAELHWSLYGVPEQIENEAQQEAYWELQKFLTMALKANPNILECLYTPLIELATPLGEELLGMREMFLSRMVYQTYNGYVMSQFKKLTGDLRNQGQVKWKHVMHLIRLLLSGITVLSERRVPVRVNIHRDRLLAIRAGEIPWEEINAWRLDLHRQFEDAYLATTLPERPDYERANAFLLKARRQMVSDNSP